jgi:amino acid transporter
MLALRSAFALKLFSAIVGAALVILSLGYFADEFGYLQTTGFPGFADIIIIISILAAFLSGIALLTELPNSIRVRFQRPPRARKPNEVYGFSTILAIGLGATLGSPLFILIPLNVVQYQITSVGSLIIAAVLSLGMAKIYSTSYSITNKNNLDSVGGPAFLKAAAGKRSFRYFVSRVSMAVANTALAAYSTIVFALFDFQFMPGLLASYGVRGLSSQLFLYLIVGLFVGWFVLNSIFESRFIRLIGRIQILFTVALVVILIYNSELLGASNSWKLAGIFSTINLPGGNWPYALLINTAYLYLLFFGFQEIQAMEREIQQSSRIPIVSWIKKDFVLDKSKCVSLAMVCTVASASLINIFYALGVYASHPDITSLRSTQIPALYLAQTKLGLGVETSMAIAFMISTFTTFVPSFMAASRHISSLSEDGFMPHSISRISWVFVLISIGILSVAGESFLVSITDFMVLVSLGMISFSAIWLVKVRKSAISSTDFLPLVIGLGCFVAAAAVYLFNPSVAVFGSLAVLVAYLLFDIFELGSLGIELFLVIFNLTMYSFLNSYSHGFVSQDFFLFKLLQIPPLSSSTLTYVMITTSVLLLANFGINTRLRSRKNPQSRIFA